MSNFMEIIPNSIKPLGIEMRICGLLLSVGTGLRSITNDQLHSPTDNVHAWLLSCLLRLSTFSWQLNQAA